MPEPILWCNKAVRSQRARVYNEKTGQMEVAFKEGKPVYEKVPAFCHVGGDYLNPVVSTKRTWIHYLRREGHEVRMKLTNAASDLDITSAHANERRAKARFFGWIPVGACPLALVFNGDLNEGQLLAKELHGQSPCPRGSHDENKPCPHYLVERKARRDEQARETQRTEDRNQGEARKIMREQRAQTAEIVSGVSESLAAALREFVATKPKSK